MVNNNEGFLLYKLLSVPVQTVTSGTILPIEWCISNFGYMYTNVGGTFSFNWKEDYRNFIFAHFMYSNGPTY